MSGTDYTDSITVATADGTAQVVTVTITGTDDRTVITGVSTQSLTETNAVLSTSGALVATDPDSSNAFVVQANVAGAEEYRTVSMCGCGAGRSATNTEHSVFVADTDSTDSITVALHDGLPMLVTVTITGTDDRTVITGVSTQSLTETNAVLSTSGALVATDPDSSNAFVVQANVAGDNGYGKFSIGAGGAWTYTTNTAHDQKSTRLNSTHVTTAY